MLLLNTNVVSELRKVAAGKAWPSVTNWSTSAPPGTMFTSVITLLELELGVLGVERRDAASGVALRTWLETRVIPAFAGRMLAVDAAVTRRCAALQVPDRRAERDALIAATALVHGMSVVTRNVRDFEPMGVTVVNPWKSATDGV